MPFLRRARWQIEKKAGMGYNITIVSWERIGMKIDLITGFLGAGKTTLLKHYARYLLGQGLSIGILEFDHGAVNVDMMLLKDLRGDHCELEMVAAGCDEDCLRRRFRSKLISMAMCGYDRIIMEPSGVFDMDWFFDTLREEPLDSWYEVGSVICVVSAKLPRTMDAASDFLLASQAACAGKIVLSRTQMATEAELAGARDHIAAAIAAIHGGACPEERFLAKDFATLEDADFEALSRCGFHAGDYVKTVAGGGDPFQSVYFLNFACRSLAWLSERTAALFADAACGQVMRVKGFVHLDGACHELNATADGIDVRPIAEGQDVLIVIGMGLDEARIRSLLAE